MDGQTETPLVELYEDSGGGLYLKRDDSLVAHGGLEHAAPGQFAVDAAELAAGRIPHGADIPVIADEMDRSETRLVATWDAGHVVHVVRPPQMSTAARRYIGLEGER